MSLRGRVFVATAATVLIAVGLTLVVGALLVRRAAQDQVLANLGRQADLIAARAAGGNVASAQLFAVRRSLLRQGERVTLMPAGALPEGQGRRGSSLYAARTVGGRTLVLSRPAALRAADWHPFVRGFLLAGGVGVALAALASLLVARAIALPVTRVARATQALAAGEQPDPVPETGSGELAVLAASFNWMAAQLAGAREAERTFLMSVSHELRTPLTAIRGYAEGLADGAVEPAQAAAVIERESGRLERLVSDLLQLARLERRSSFSVRREPVDLGAVVTDVVSRYQAQARELGVGLAAEGDGVAQADTDRAVQVVSNLVEKALRCTPAGGRVRAVAEPGGVRVEDTGPGLDEEAQGRAFERFFLYDRYGGERPVGSGLGLAIVKELTQAMGGNVSVESGVGVGTTFSVRLPS